MEFFDRKREIEKLRAIRARSHEGAAFTVMTGRRRVGKTELVKRAFADEPFVYLYVTRSAEADLCAGFKERIESYTGRSIPGRVSRFGELFRYLLQHAGERPLTVVIDEFQDFCENAFKGTLDFYEVKRDARRYDRAALEQKVESFFAKNPEMRDRRISCRGLSLKDVSLRQVRPGDQPRGVSSADLRR